MLVVIIGYQPMTIIGGTVNKINKLNKNKYNAI